MTRHVLAGVFLSVLVWAFVAVPAGAQVDANATTEQLWTDAVYYIKIGRMDMGQSYLKALVERKPAAVELLEFSEKDPTAAKTLIKLQADKDLGPLVAKVLTLIDEGWQQRRQDQKRIGAELDRLGESPRGQFLATNRLVEAGEYAVPVMVAYLSDAEKKPVHGQIIEAIVKLGREAVEPLVVALQHVDTPAKVLIIDAMARLDYPQVLPYLQEIAANAKENAQVRQSATTAIESILERNPKYRNDMTAAQSFAVLASRYYTHDSAMQPGRVAADSVAADPRSTMPNVWLWKDGKLVNQPVPAEIYYEIMTMRLSRRSIELDGSLDSALTLWLMANCKRQLRLSETVIDPLHGEGTPDSGYFFRTAGTSQCLSALDRANRDKDIALQLAALNALADVASGNDILAARGEAQPIAKALATPNASVQTWAALALGAALPENVYPGVGDVVPVLGKALAGAKKPVAWIVTADEKKGTAWGALLTSLNFEVAVATVEKGVPQASAVELIVIDYDLPTPGAGQAVAQIGANPVLTLVPTVVVAEPAKVDDAKIVFKGATQVAVVPGVVDPKVIGGTVAALMKQLGRSVPSAKDGATTAVLAAKALERLASADQKNYPVASVTAALATAATSDDWTLAEVSGRVLAKLPADAQKALATAALGRKDVAQQIVMFESLRTSVRRLGNKLSADQVAAFEKIVLENKDDAQRNAAAAVLGALNLPSSQARKVVVTKETFGQVGGQ